MSRSDEDGADLSFTLVRDGARFQKGGDGGGCDREGKDYPVRLTPAWVWDSTKKKKDINGN